MIYLVISEEIHTKGIVIFEGSLKACYEYQRTCKGSKYPSLSFKEKA